MHNINRFFARSLIATTLVTALGGCGTPAQSNSTEPVADSPASTASSASAASPTSTESPVPAEPSAEEAPAATFEDAKYITSDANQTEGNESNAFHELCAIRPPETWSQVESISWNPSSIEYDRIPTDWGTISYRYEYINEAGYDASSAGLSRTTEEGYFGNGVATEHASIGDHEVVYALSNSDQEQIAFGILDMDSRTASEDAQDKRFITLNAWELRGDSCAFVTFISCEVRSDAQVDLSGEQLLADAYAPLEFTTGESADSVDAAPFDANITLASADGTHEVVVRRDNADLMSYDGHSALLATNIGVMSIDFAPEGGLEGMEKTSASADQYKPEFGYANPEVSAVEEYEVDGRTFHARMLTVPIEAGDAEQPPVKEVRAWCDIEGSALYITATATADEDVPAALNRVIAGRLV